jgi:hypothetical protein
MNSTDILFFWLMASQMLTVGLILLGRRMNPPPLVCVNCFRVWCVTQPRELLLYCPHRRVAAQPLSSDGTWHVLENISRYDAALLRRELARRSTAAARGKATPSC